MALAPTSYPSRAPLLPHFPSYCSFLQESLVLWGPTWAPALLENQYGSTPFLSPGGTDSKAELLGMLSGTGRGCKGGPTRNLLQKRLLWLLGHQVGFPGLTAALAAFFFYLLRVVSRVTAGGRHNANDSGSAWRLFRRKKAAMFSLPH